MKTNTIPLFTLSALILGFLLTTAVHIQVAHAEVAVSGTAEVRQNIQLTDLGVTNSGTLPTSPFYFFKEWKRGVERMFTWNAVANAELELRVTNEKAAEALTIQEVHADDEDALTMALENYTEAVARLQVRLTKLNDTTPNLEITTLLKKFDEQSMTHALLFDQIVDRWRTDPYVEDTNVVNPRAARDNHLQGAVDVLQKKIHDAVIIAADKDTNSKEKAEAEITRAESAITELEGALAGACIAIDEAGTSQLKTAPVRIDSTPARISTNMTTERQTPKRDFGDRMKAGLEQAGGMLAQGRAAYAAGNFGEAFGHARSAEVLAIGHLRQCAAHNPTPQSESHESPLYEEQSSMNNPLYEQNSAQAKPCGPQPGAPGKWVCKNGVWALDAQVLPRPTETTAPSTCGQIRCFRYDPVCGTDGKTYGCGGVDAESCGVRVAYSGECTVAPTELKPIEVKPTEGMACTQQYDPVCGVNGKTYGNACMANIAGIVVKQTGECPASTHIETHSQISPTVVVEPESPTSGTR